MKLPGGVVLILKGIDAAFGIAEWFARRSERKRAKGLSFKDVQRINSIARKAGHETSVAKTVILPKRP